MRDEVLIEYRQRVRTILCGRLRLPATEVVAITDEISQAAATAIDSEVEQILDHCGLNLEDHGGSFL